MHAPSALLAGVVLTFGVTALANLYLPPAAVASVRASSASVEADLQPPLDAALSQQEPVISDAFEIETPENRAAAVTPIATAGESKEGEIVSPRDRETVESPRTQAKTAPTQGQQKSVPAQKSAVSESKGQAPEAPSHFVPSFASSALRKASPTTPAGASAGVSVSAISGERAWIRIGDTRTVAVRSGEQVDNMGRVKSITADSVVFENGLTLKVSP